MAVEDALKYIRENKAQYSTEGLISALKENGFSEDEIQEAFKLDSSKAGAAGPKRAVQGVKPPRQHNVGKVLTVILEVALGGLIIWALTDPHIRPIITDWYFSIVKRVSSFLLWFFD